MKSKLSLVAGIFIGAVLFSASIASAISVFNSNQVGNSAANGFVLQTTGPNNASVWVSTTTLGIGGGGGTPGGLNAQIQYNNSGSFGGITGATTDGTSVSLSGAHLLNPTVNGAGTGLATLAYPNTSSNATITFPTVTGTLATLAGTEALTNKSVNGVTLTAGGSATTFLNGTGTYTVPAGGSGLSTSTPWTVGQLAYVVSNAAVSSVATGTLSASVPLSVTAGRSVIGGAAALSITQAGSGTDGYLSSTDWNTFNGKGSGTVTSVSGSGGTTGLTLTGGAITTSGTLTLGGTLAIANGGTGVTSVTTAPAATSFAGWDANKNLSANNFIGGFTTAAGAGGTTVLTITSSAIQELTGFSGQTMQLPNTSILAGYQLTIINSTISTVTVTASGGSTIVTLAAGTSATFTALSATPIVPSSWKFVYNAGSGTVTSVAASVPSFLSISGSPVTTSGTLAISYSGTALPIANGGTNATSFGTSNGITAFDGTRLVNFSGYTLTSLLLTATNASTTQLTVSSGLQIPNAASSPSLGVAGYVAVDTTAASSSLRFGDGTATRSLYAAQTGSLVVSSSTLSYLGTFGTAGTTSIIIQTVYRPTTILGAYCVTDTGTAKIDFTNLSTFATTNIVNCSTTPTFVSFSSNNAWIMGQNINLEVGTKGSNPNTITVSAQIRADAD